MNQARIENDHFTFHITGQESRILTIKMPFQEKIKIFSERLLDVKRESRNGILGFKKRNIKDQERMMTIYYSIIVFFYPLYTKNCISN